MKYGTFLVKHPDDPVGYGGEGKAAEFHNYRSE